MKTKNTNKTQNKKEGQKEVFYYIIYQYNDSLNDIEYLTSKKDLVSAINCINGLLLSNGDTINLIKDIEKIIKNRNISKYITLDIENLKVINKYIIFKQYDTDKTNKKYILNEIEKQTKNNEIIIHKMYKKEVINYTYNSKKRSIKNKPIKIKKLDKKDAFKKYMEIKKKIQNNFNRLHDNKNILQGGALYEN